MAEIHIQRRHAMPLKKARDAANDFARRLNEKFELESEWEGDALHFERSGVSGRLMLTRNDVTIDLKPGFLLSAFAGKMEGSVRLAEGGVKSRRPKPTVTRAWCRIVRSGAVLGTR